VNLSNSFSLSFEAPLNTINASVNNDIDAINNGGKSNKLCPWYSKLPRITPVVINNNTSGNFNFFVINETHTPMSKTNDIYVKILIASKTIITTSLEYLLVCFIY